jgi:hypothetical protein
MSLRRDESADHVIRTSIGWYEAGALSLTANSKKICPPQWYRLAAAVLLQHAVILFILLPNAHLLTIGYRPEFTTVVQTPLTREMWVMCACTLMMKLHGSTTI